MKNQSFEISIIYRSDEGREVSFLDLLDRRDVMDLKHFEPDAFWSMLGGLDVTSKGHFTIFHGCSFYCLVKATSFLIHSMYWIKGVKSEWFDTDDTFPNDVIVYPTPQTIMRLQSISENEMQFSYLPVEKNYESLRGDKYFADIKLSKVLWFEQANIALNEYFMMMKFVLNGKDQNDSQISVMNDYMKVWENIS